jgi:hypothetical protein
MSTSSNNNRIVYILLAVAAVIVLLCGGFFVFKVGNSLLGETPISGTQSGGVNRTQTFPKGEDASGMKGQQVVDAFLLELNKEQLEDAYQRTSIGFQGSMSQSDFNAFVQKNRGLVGWTRKHIKGAAPGNQMMMMKGHLSGGPNPGIDFTIEVGMEPQGWRITKFTVP